MNQQSGKRLRGTEYKEQQKPQHQDSTQRTFHRANRKASDRTETPHPWRASHKNNKMLNPNPLATLLAFNQSKSARTATKGKATSFFLAAVSEIEERTPGDPSRLKQIHHLLT